MGEQQTRLQTKEYYQFNLNAKYFRGKGARCTKCNGK